MLVLCRSHFCEVSHRVTHERATCLAAPKLSFSKARKYRSRSIAVCKHSRRKTHLSLPKSSFRLRRSSWIPDLVNISGLKHSRRLEAASAFVTSGHLRQSSWLRMKERAHGQDDKAHAKKSPTKTHRQDEAKCGIALIEISKKFERSCKK